MARGFQLRRSKPLPGRSQALLTTAEVSPWLGISSERSVIGRHREALRRAVARASNRVAILIPCHRVTRGYRWDLGRKRACWNWRGKNG
jgi:hypothetical protein